ncbi:hypothetical protein [Teredinibacter sp. KSP-S5-2]|uniref:hypothetical protein n=1 Tax=Teredinibacter sp. KSP-S5-2 TaxID=3034506 RepID=UPI0029348B09|nr:hypothetical protein [Teredinibacter sp. KSP-S5-2]WNO08885.1 hypothetical protein P5V12_18095 [Teredinibacter sp. KSP-S5-2]
MEEKENNGKLKGDVQKINVLSILRKVALYLSPVFVYWVYASGKSFSSGYYSGYGISSNYFPGDSYNYLYNAFVGSSFLFFDVLNAFGEIASYFVPGILFFIMIISILTSYDDSRERKNKDGEEKKKSHFVIEGLATAFFAWIFVFVIILGAFFVFSIIYQFPISFYKYGEDYAIKEKDGYISCFSKPVKEREHECTCVYENDKLISAGNLVDVSKDWIAIYHADSVRGESPNGKVILTVGKSDFCESSIYLDKK